MFGFSSFLKGGSVVSIVRSLLFTFGLPGAWESSSSGVFTLDDPSQVKTVDGIRLHSLLTRQQTVGLRSISAQKTQAGYFGNDGDMCDAMDGMSCGELRVASSETLACGSIDLSPFKRHLVHTAREAADSAENPVRSAVVCREMNLGPIQAIRLLRVFFMGYLGYQGSLGYLAYP